MFTVHCPICQKRMEVENLDSLPSLPFCSERCRLIDLGRWLGGQYRIPVGPDSADQSNEEETVP
ncbi:MAG: DNA gyrase inhibitor YacG [Gemmatales bacterium]|nr:DNA gyrase inhibitor YacG [Gemmatales bacterium]